MQDTFSMLFYLKSNDINKKGKAPIYLRITVDGKRAEVSIKRTIEPRKWGLNGKVKGSNAEANALNRYMNHIRTRIYTIQEGFVKVQKPYTAQQIKNSFLDKGNRRKTLLTLILEHNEQIGKLVGKEYSYGHHKRFVRTYLHLVDFIKEKYNLDDMFLVDIDLKFIQCFEYYLKLKEVGNHNTVTKYVTNLKKIMRIAYANDWIRKDPFYHWKAQWKKVEREFLTEQEIQALLDKPIFVERLAQVRDIFLFCCFTGLSYVDVKKLSNDHIVIGLDGDRWIKTKRTKTNVRSNVPLLPLAEAILEKYKNHPKVKATGYVLPVLSNQRSNAYLKEIADICGISKNLTFHLARHTFATTVTLSNGVPIESVSKMLGHRSLKTTQLYAKILDKKVKDDMDLLKKKFG